MHFEEEKRRGLIAAFERDTAALVRGSRPVLLFTKRIDPHQLI
jgi:hypothetical protein